MNDQANTPLPTAGRPVTTVLQINNATRRQEPVFAELSDGRVRKISRARRKQLVFQVQLEEGKQWESSPRRVWVEKVSRASAEQAARPVMIIQRTPVGSRSLEDLQALFFQTPLWLESATGDWVIMPQIARHQLVLKRWREERGVLNAPLVTELVALMRAHQVANQLLSEDEQAPLSAWLIAQPIVEEAPSLPVSS
jgi:hypothetical protein